MTLDEFKLLDSPEGDQNAARMSYIANMILGQNPRLLRGEDMAGPCGVYTNGKSPTGPELASIADYFEPANQAQAVQATPVVITQEQLSGHPWLTMPAPVVGNYLHMYEVTIRSLFGDLQSGSFIRVSYGDRRIDALLTQQMIDDNTWIVARFAISK